MLNSLFGLAQEFGDPLSDDPVLKNIGETGNDDSQKRTIQDLSITKTFSSKGSFNDLILGVKTTKIFHMSDGTDSLVQEFIRHGGN